MAFVNFLSNFTNGLFGHFVCFEKFFVNFLSNFTNGLFRHFVCFEKFNSPVSELIHLARCVKLNPYFIPGIVLIVFYGTQSNRRTNFIPRLAGFNPRLALIVFSGSGARQTLESLKHGQFGATIKKKKKREAKNTCPRTL